MFFIIKGALEAKFFPNFNTFRLFLKMWVYFSFLIKTYILPRSGKNGKIWKKKVSVLVKENTTPHQPGEARLCPPFSCVSTVLRDVAKGQIIWKIFAFIFSFRLYLTFTALMYNDFAFHLPFIEEKN